MDYEIRSKDGKLVIPLTDSEVFQIASAIDGRTDAEGGAMYPDEDDQKEQDAIYEILYNLRKKLEDANLGGYFKTP